MTPHDSPALPTAPGTAPGTAPKRSRMRRLAGFVALAFSLSVLVLGAFVGWSLRVGTEITSLRSVVETVSGRSVDTKVAFRLGWPVLTVARWISSAAVDDPAVPEILRGMGRVEVCVSELKPGGNGSPDSFHELLKRGDEHLAKSGWQRAVGVVESDQVVGIYTQTRPTDGESLELLVLVYEKTELVIVRGQCHVGVLADLVAGEMPRHGPLHRLAVR